MSSQSANHDPACQALSNASLEQFLQHGLYLRNWSPRTARAYRLALRDLPPTLTKASLEAWIIAFRQQQHTPGGINVRIRALNSYLSWLRAEREGVAVPTPLKLMKAPQRAIQTLSVAEIRSLLAQKPSRTRTLVALLLDVGIRIDEALTLERSKVDLDDLVLTVRGKGSRERVVPFSLEMRKHLFRHLQGAPQSRFVFSTRRGGRLQYRNVGRDISTLCAMAGIIRHVHPHLFRHTFAATYIRKGGDIYRLSRILGHTQLSTTQLYLRSLGVDDFRAGLERLTPLAS
jgi:integrase/recombinase XerD